ncbi:MAG: acyl-CoA dehydrogenase family protein [Deltaproteobacteria bacterium]|nr:acyl-CoA dehydrogenase family protein [Deltaproteobacteria bacterium]
MLDQYLNDSHRAYRETCLRFAEREIRPHAEKWEEAHEFPRELYTKAAEAGILGSHFPEEYGGSAGDIFHAIVAIEALMTGQSTGVVVGLDSLGIALPPILNLGDEEQKRRFIPPVLRGEKISALGITEPGAGSDVAGVSTRAVRDGDSYVLNGAKMFITSGVRADQVTVLARTDEHPHNGLTFFVVEKGMAGFSVGRALRKTGWWASDTAELVFEDVRVPIENRIGEEGSGFVGIMRNFQTERISLGVFGSCTADLALKECLRYVAERKAFGRPLQGFQVIRHKLANMATKVEATKALTYSVANRFNQGEYLVKEVSMAKNFAAEVAQQVCYDAVQIFGGMGYMRETFVERLARDARLLPIGGGTTEMMNEIIAKMLGLGN